MKSLIIGLVLISIPVRGYCQDGIKKSGAFVKKPADSKPQDEQPVYLDMSKPDKPESEFPEISKKGNL